jgi:hypothetical protein
MRVPLLLSSKVSRFRGVFTAREIMEKHLQMKEENDSQVFFSTKRKAGSLHLDT